MGAHIVGDRTVDEGAVDDGDGLQPLLVLQHLPGMNQPDAMVLPPAATLVYTQ